MKISEIRFYEGVNLPNRGILGLTFIIDNCWMVRNCVLCRKKSGDYFMFFPYYRLNKGCLNVSYPITEECYRDVLKQVLDAYHKQFPKEQAV